LILLLLADTKNTKGMNQLKKNENVGVSVNKGTPARALTAKYYLLNFRLRTSVDT